MTSERSDAAPTAEPSQLTDEQILKLAEKVSGNFAHRSYDEDLIEFARAAIAAAAPTAEPSQREWLEKARFVGRQFSNVAFNWSQMEGRTLTADDCAMLKRLQQEWDEAAAHLQAHPAPVGQPVAWVIEDAYGRSFLTHSAYVALDLNLIPGRTHTPLYAAPAGEDAAHPAPVGQPVKLRFPTMLRKMWSGGEVQEWLDSQPPLYAAPVVEDAAQEADARRYRWLRDHRGNNRVPHVTQYPYCPEIDQVKYPYFGKVGLDAAIDAAMSQEPK